MAPPQSRHSSTFRGSTSSIASSARDRDLTRRRLTSSSCPLFLSSTSRGSIKKGFTPGGTLLLFPTETITLTHDFNSYWSSSGRSPFRLKCTESFEHAFLNYIQRSVINAILCRKKQNFVNFDLQGVDMSRFALDGFDNKFSKFNLYAVSTPYSVEL